ncbi:GLPGLI family protein [Kaistella flava (ex Peng et al. 2021)]|uniref:GLPGLI family protein n=1 Tax=Kaistella flava (ex Peng et al. 2021) TaxID=2038776 RepID=A0A7M2YBA7_9FLAO|nr:GLPGLI family protein [Kaistella flava (ex Peng et al. 2021)]QOW11441.1 GLPGLI family protein [Kaistella flava (ex Peng et al. 2021)]
MKYLILFLFPFLLSAQTHRFIYEYQFKSDSLAKELIKENMILDINPEDVKFYPYFFAENDSINKLKNNNNSSWDDALPVLTRSLNTNKNISYVLLNDLFSIQTEDPVNWKLSTEIKKVANYNLQKATTTFGGRNWTAWFNTDINLNEGPYKFRGLPGLIFEIADDRNNFSFSLVKSYQLKSTYNTSEFLESFAGKKAIPISEKILRKKQLELFNDPLQDFKEMFKNSNGEGTFSVMGVKIKSLDQFKELTTMTQERMRKDNNPIELDKAIHYTKK